MFRPLPQVEPSIKWLPPRKLPDAVKLPEWALSCPREEPCLGDGDLSGEGVEPRGDKPQKVPYGFCMIGARWAGVMGVDMPQ